MTIEQLLATLVARKHAHLPLAPDVRYTENGQTLNVGDGMWGTLTRYAGDADASAVPPPLYQVLFADAGGDAVYFGGSVETTTPGMLVLRLKQRDGRIAEIEAIAVREEKPGERGGTVTLFQPSLLTHFEGASFASNDPRMLLEVPPTASNSRSQLAAVVDRYFDAVQSNDSRAVAFAENCQRRDNGVQVTGNAAAPPLDPGVPAYRPFSLGCADQIDSGFFKRIARVRGRRHIAIDERRGLVLSVALMDQPGDVAEIEVPAIGRVALPSGIRPEDLSDTEDAAQFYVKRYEPNFRVPMTELTAQLTKVEAGRVARIESISRGAPFGLSCGWS